MKNRIIVGVLVIMTGALLAVGPYTLFEICDQGHHEGHSICFWTRQVTLGIGIVLILLGVFYIVFNDPGIHAGLSIGIAAGFVLTLLVANVLIGVDDDPMMSCRTTTLPALNVISVLSFVLAVVNTGYLLRLIRIRDAQATEMVASFATAQAAQKAEGNNEEGNNEDT
jgi:hypothetical protein